MFDKMQIQQLRTFDISVRLMFTIFGECNGARSQRRHTCLNNGTKLMRIDANFLALKSFLIDEKRGKKIQIYVRVRTRAVQFFLPNVSKYYSSLCFPIFLCPEKQMRQFYFFSFFFIPTYLHTREANNSYRLVFFCFLFHLSILICHLESQTIYTRTRVQVYIDCDDSFRYTCTFV